MYLSFFDSILMIAAAFAGAGAGASRVIGRRDGGGDKCSIGKPNEALGCCLGIEIRKTGYCVSSWHVGIVITIITITTIVKTVILTHN
jgi:hypothetical protein